MYFIIEKQQGVCPICGQKFDNIKRSKKIFCSTECYNKGKKEREKEYRKKISDEDILFTLVSHKYSCFLCDYKAPNNEINSNNGFHAMACLQAGVNLKYLGGYEFDMGILRNTGLEIHHINPKIQGGGDERSNLIPLCINCHDIIHGKKTINDEMIDTMYKINSERTELITTLIDEHFKESVIEMFDFN